jgi:hypothetical protein
MNQQRLLIKLILITIMMRINFQKILQIMILKKILQKTKMILFFKHRQIQVYSLQKVFLSKYIFIIFYYFFFIFFS